MPVVALLAVAAVMGPVGWGLATALGRPGRSLAIARRNLTRGLFSPVLEVGSLESRRNGGGALLRTLTPDAAAARVRRLLELVGRADPRTMSLVLSSKLGAAAVGGVLALAVFASAPGVGTALLLLAVVAGAYHLPELLLWSRGRERQQAIELALPDTLDQMTIAVEAGLGFDAALTRAAAFGKGPLAEELTRTLQDVAVGRPRREAYNALLRRTDVADLRRFVGAVNQADSYGIAITDVLRAQADDLRLKRRQRAEERAMQVPVKVVFPLMVCILPALLLVVLGPAVMNLMHVLP